MNADFTPWIAAYSWGVVQGSVELMRAVRDWLAQPMPSGSLLVIDHPWYVARDSARKSAIACSKLISVDVQLPAAFGSDTDQGGFGDIDTKVSLWDASWPTELNELQNQFKSLALAFREVEWILLFDRLDDASDLAPLDVRVRKGRNAIPKKRNFECDLRAKGGRLQELMIVFERLAIAVKMELVRIEKSTLQARSMNQRVLGLSGKHGGIETAIGSLKSWNENDARDLWIYEHAHVGRPWNEIMKEFLPLAKQRGWEAIESVPGLRQAVRRYVKRHNLPEIPRRDRGPRRPK